MFDSNPYYNPEAFGLEIVGSVEWDDEPYQFDMTIVWKDANGILYYAHDSGCSCPSPFEDYRSLSSLNQGTRHGILKVISDKVQDHWANDDDSKGKRLERASDLISKVASL